MRHRASVAPGKEAPGLEGQGRPSEGVQPSMSTRQLFFATRTPTGGDSTLDPPRRLAWLSGGWHCLAMCTLAAFLTSSDAGSGAARPTSAAPAAAWAALPSALVLTVTAAQRYLHLKWHVDFEDRWMLLDAVDVLAVAAFIVSMLAPADVLTPEGDWVADGAWVRHRAAWPAVVTSLGFAPLLVAATSLHRFLCWRAGAMNTRTAHSTTAVRTRRAVLFANCAVALLAALTGALASSSLWLGNHAQSTAQMETAAGALTAALAATCGGMASDSAAACASAIASASTSAPVCLEALGFAVDGATLYRAPGLSAAESATLSDALAGLLAGGQAWYGRAWVAVRGSGGSHSGVGVFADACFGQEAGALVLAKVLVSAAAVACMLALTWSLYLRAITPLLRALGGVMSCAAFLTDQGLVLTHETDAVDLEPSVERVVRAMRLLIRASFRGRNVVKKLLAEAVNATEHDSGVLQIYGLDLRAWVKQRRQSGWVAKPTGLLPGRADEAPPPSGRMEAAEGITGAVAAMPEASMRRPSKQQSEMPGWFPLMKRKPAQSGGLSADCRVPSAQGPAGLPPCVSVPDVPPWLPHLGTFDWDVLSLSDEAATEAVVEMFRRLGLTDQGPWEPGVFQKPAVFKSRMGDAASRRDASRKDLATASVRERRRTAVACACVWFCASANAPAVLPLCVSGDGRPTLGRPGEHAQGGGLKGGVGAAAGGGVGRHAGALPAGDADAVQQQPLPPLAPRRGRGPLDLRAPLPRQVLPRPPPVQGRPPLRHGGRPGARRGAPWRLECPPGQDGGRAGADVLLPRHPGEHARVGAAAGGAPRGGGGRAGEAEAGGRGGRQEMHRGHHLGDGHGLPLQRRGGTGGDALEAVRQGRDEPGVVRDPRLPPPRPPRPLRRRRPLRAPRGAAAPPQPRARRRPGQRRQAHPPPRAVGLPRHGGVLPGGGDAEGAGDGAAAHHGPQGVLRPRCPDRLFGVCRGSPLRLPVEASAGRDTGIGAHRCQPRLLVPHGGIRR